MMFAVPYYMTSTVYSQQPSRVGTREGRRARWDAHSTGLSFAVQL